MHIQAHNLILPPVAERQPEQEFSDNERLAIRQALGVPPSTAADHWYTQLRDSSQQVLGQHWAIGRALFLFDAAGLWAEYDTASLSDFLSEYSDDLALSKTQLLKLRRVYDTFVYRLDALNIPALCDLLVQFRNIDRLDALTSFIMPDTAQAWMKEALVLSMSDLYLRRHNARRLMSEGVSPQDILPEMCESEIELLSNSLKMSGIKLSEVDWLKICDTMSASATVDITARKQRARIEIEITTSE